MGQVTIPKPQPNQKTMKKGFLLLLTALLFTFSVSAQNNEIDELFKRFSSIEGATHMNLSGALIDMFFRSSDDKNVSDAAKKISHIQLLTFSGEHQTDFFQSVTGSLSKTRYSELMRIHDSGNQFVVLADMDEKTVSELILVGGGNENVLIRIRGNMSLDDVNDISGSTSMNVTGRFGFDR
ncbi:MAG: DUF4252 domain-containing protein [Balneolaceae bacterium]|nr:MAG: DUF4252 domain-containing protein [Balneolaceae bacterium]